MDIENLTITEPVIENFSGSEIWTFTVKGTYLQGFTTFGLNHVWHHSDKESADRNYEEIKQEVESKTYIEKRYS